MTTFDQAQRRWCPFVRAVRAPSGDTFDTRGDVYGYGKCIADGCMAWRWGPVTHQQFRVHVGPNAKEQVEEPERPRMVPASWEWFPANGDEDTTPGWLEPRSEADARRQGYCGLAGTPFIGPNT